LQDFLICFDLGDTLGLFTTVFCFFDVLTFLIFSGLCFFALACASRALFYASTTLLSVVCIITGCYGSFLTGVVTAAATPLVLFFFFFVTVYIM
jgi:hypothetical protein